eukprot:TsM_000328000 transcript=TsM_000328000 gene=TsM_000328000
MGQVDTIADGIGRRRSGALVLLRAIVCCLSQRVTLLFSSSTVAGSDAGDSAGRGGEGDCARHRV